jgi:hypothetical protein
MFISSIYKKIVKITNFKKTIKKVPLCSIPNFLFHNVEVIHEELRLNAL